MVKGRDVNSPMESQKAQHTNGEVSDGARVEVSDLCATSPCLSPIPRKSLPHVFSYSVGNHFKTVIEHACSLREFPRIWTV